MNGKAVALDMSVAIAVLNGTGEVRRWFSAHGVLCIPVPVAGELLFGARNSRYPDGNKLFVDKLISRCAVLPVDLATADVYATVRRQLKVAGKLIPENDVWIAALCLQHSIPLATSDAHFAVVDGLEVVKPS